MNFNKFHNMLERRKRACGEIKTNCVKLPEDPSGMIDCTPEGNYENFKGLMDGCNFYYCEVNNSTPVYDGYHIKKEDECLVQLYENITCVFDEEALEAMGKQLVGKGIHNYFRDDKFNRIGTVTDAWVWKIHELDRYSVLSLIFNLNDKGKELALKLRNKINFYFGLLPRQTRCFCCNCGEELKAGFCHCGDKKYILVKNPTVSSVIEIK